MQWEILNIIGTIAFALSGAIVAMEERYDVMGAYVLGFCAAFGGGAIRNLLIGAPISLLWQQGPLFVVTFAAITLVFFLPCLLRPWMRWGNLFDAMGLGAFAIQGALYATSMHHPLVAVVAAAALTGAGGGIIRDLLAGRKPLVLQAEIYITWAVLAGLLVGTGLVSETTHAMALLVAVVLLRMLSVQMQWRLPRRSLHPQ